MVSIGVLHRYVMTNSPYFTTNEPRQLLIVYFHDFPRLLCLAADYAPGQGTDTFQNVFHTQTQATHAKCMFEVLITQLSHHGDVSALFRT